MGGVRSYQGSMKVLKAGVKAWRKEINHECGSILEIEASDVIRPLIEEIDESYFIYAVLCPQCGGYARLNGLPDWVERMARTK